MGVFTIGIAEEDRPRRWRAHRHCTNGRAVSPITCWVALAPKAEWAGGRRLLLSSGTTLLAGAPGQCSGRRAQLKPPFPVPIGRGRSYTAPGAPGLHSPRRCRVKKEHTCWPHLDRNVEVNPGRRLSFASKVCLWEWCGPNREKNEKRGVEPLAPTALLPLAAPGGSVRAP